MSGLALIEVASDQDVRGLLGVGHQELKSVGYELNSVGDVLLILRREGGNVDVEGVNLSVRTISELECGVGNGVLARVVIRDSHFALFGQDCSRSMSSSLSRFWLVVGGSCEY